MSYSPEELRLIAKIVSEWDSEAEAELLAELRGHLDVMPQTALEVSVEAVKDGFEEFYVQMLRRRTSLLVLRHRAIGTCDDLIIRYLPEVTLAALSMPNPHLLPSLNNNSFAHLDARRAFISLLKAVNDGLRILWMTVDPIHVTEIEQSSRDIPIQGYELCIDRELQYELRRFDHMKSVVLYERSNDFTIFDALNDFFEGIRNDLTNFVNAFVQNPGVTTLATVDGILQGVGFYTLVDAVIYGLEGAAYVTHNFIETVRIAAGEYPTWDAARPPEWGARREYAADVFWTAVEGLGGEDVRTHPAFQEARSTAEKVTQFVTLFQGVRSLYNLVQGVGGAGGAALGLSDDVAQIGGSGAAAIVRTREVVQVADSVPWVEAADVINVVRASILGLSSGDDGGSAQNTNDTADATNLPRTPGGRRYTPHAADNIRTDFRGRVERVDEVIDRPSEVKTQLGDGSTVYIQRNAGRARTYDVVIVNVSDPNGPTVVTVIRVNSPHELDNLASNYDWVARDPFDNLP